MQAQNWRDRQITYGRLVRFVVLGLFIVFLIIAGVFWILSLTGLVASIWASIFSTIFVVLGVILAFLQWVAPRSSVDSQPVAALQQHPAHPPTNDEAYNRFIEDEREMLLNDPDAAERGALVIRADKSMLGQEVHIGWERTRISQHNILGQPIYVAFLPRLTINNYQVEMQGRDTIWVTVHPRQVSELDWRSGV